MTIKQYKKLARAAARSNGTSYQSELDAIADGRGYRSWGDFQKSLRASPLSNPRAYEVDHVADLLDALSTCMLRGRHLVVNRDGDHQAEQALIEDLKTYIATLTGGDTGRVRWCGRLADVDLDHAKDQYLTWVATSRGADRLIAHGNHMVPDAMAELSHSNAIAKLSERNLIEMTTDLSMAIGREANGLPMRPDTIGRTTITRVPARNSHLMPARTFIDLFLPEAPGTEEDRALLEDVINGYMAEPAGADVREYVEDYEFRGDGFDLRPDDRQRTMMRRAIAEWLRMGPAASAPVVNPTFQMDETRYLRGPHMPYETAYHLRDAWHLPEASCPPELKGLRFVPSWNPLSEERIPHASPSERERVRREYLRQICLVLLSEGKDYFEDNARQALYGLILMHMDEAHREGREPSMPGVMDMLNDMFESVRTRRDNGHDDEADLVKEEIDSRILSMEDRTHADEARSALATVLAAPANERSGIIGTIDKSLLAFRNPVIRSRTM